MAKDLHLARNIDDLEKHFSLPDLKEQKTTVLLNSALKLYQEAEKYYKEGDEEMSYVYYMKYFNLLNSIRKKADYGQNKQNVKRILGGNIEHTVIMDKVEVLNKSLLARYKKLEEKSNNFAGNKFDLDANSNEKTKSLDKKYTFSSGDNIRGNHKSMNFMSCEELFRNIQNKSSSFLIIDCRPKRDYDLSHLHYHWCVNVPEEIILYGMSAGKLQDKLDDKSKSLWSSRSVKNQIVLLDWNCKDSNLNTNSPIYILREILQKWDPDVTYKSPIKIVEGGYEFFILMYPTLCTNPSVQAPQNNFSEMGTIEEIEYPSIYDITMKDENQTDTNSLTAFRDIDFSPPEKPSVDRQTKMAAIKIYGEKQKPIAEIIKEQEILMKKASANDQQLIEAENEWQNIRNQKEKSDDIYEQNNENFHEQQLLYNILQLESTAADYKMENNRLREELEEYKRREREQLIEKLSPKEAENLEEATKKIETIIQERQKLDEQRERDKEVREKQLAIAREQKRHLKPPTFEDGEMSKPKIPQFDRSVKPNQVALAFPTYDVQRDFSPVPGVVFPKNFLHLRKFVSRLVISVKNVHIIVFDFQETDFDWWYLSSYMMLVIADVRINFRPYKSIISPSRKGRGLTGLKNLGNTCYMNSILQCLSNTQPLADYCITNKYKKHINRSNKTKGLIAEEVAALFKVLWNGQYKCVASRDLRYVIGQYQQIFRGIEQQDSHEFLTILMDWLHSDLQTLRVQNISRDNMRASEKAWLEFTKGYESLILHLFYGQIKSTVKCVECNKESATYESFSNLSLELPSNAYMCYLHQCMDMYFNGERIHGWNCPNCKQKRDAVKKLDISKLPPILVVHLKRFYADNDSMGQSYKKKLNYVRFPLENLEMTPYIAKSELRSMSPKTYQLYGVSNHYGSMEGGHYTAFCKNGVFNKWFKFDDQVVTQLDTSNVNSSAAYILFYTWLPQIQAPEVN